MESEPPAAGPRPGLNAPNAMFPPFSPLPPAPPPLSHRNYAGFSPFAGNPDSYGYGFQQRPAYHPISPPQPPPHRHAPLPSPPSPQQFVLGPNGPAFPAFRGPFGPSSTPRHGAPALPSPPKWPSGVGNLGLNSRGQYAGNEFPAPGGLSHQIGQTLPTSRSSGASDGGGKFVGDVLLKAQSEERIDVPDLLGQIRGFVAQVESAVHAFENMTKCHSSSVEAPGKLASCPFERFHQLPPEHLFRHVLSCPSNPKPNVDSKTLISSLQYSRTIFRTGDGNSSVQADAQRLSSTGSVEDSGSRHSEKEIVPESSAASNIDIWGGRFLYQDAAAVVQKPLPPRPQLECPRFSGQFEANEGDSQPLLPSRLWLLQRESELWTEFPTRCSSLVLQAAKWLPRIRREEIWSWILLRAPAHGVVLDVSIACHVESLATFCLQSLQGEASALREGDGHGGKANQKAALETETDSSVHKEKEVEGISKVTCIYCPDLFHGGCWLASQLLPLFGPLESKKFVLELLKHCVVTSGRYLASVLIPSVGSELGKDPAKGDGEAGYADGDKLAESSMSPVVADTVDRIISAAEVELAIYAVYERSILETYLRSLHQHNRSSNIKLLQEHEDIVQRAAYERANRPRYRPVLEHDGLIWHRSQVEETGKNKTREELLAEERDYKRRRMSYRGKKLKRSPAEVLHDIITAHMDEIVAAGGIGCLAKDSSGQASIAAVPKLQSSKGSNALMNVASPAQKRKWEDPPVGSTPENIYHEMASSSKYPRGQSIGRDHWSSESSVSKAAKQSYADSGVSAGSGKHARILPREEDFDYERNRQRSYREPSGNDSYRTSKRDGDHHRSHSRSRDQTRDSEDYGRESKRNYHSRSRAQTRDSEDYERESKRNYHSRSRDQTRDSEDYEGESKRNYQRGSESRGDERGASRSFRKDDNEGRKHPRYESSYSDRWEGSSDDTGIYNSVKEKERKGHRGK